MEEPVSRTFELTQLTSVDLSQAADLAELAGRPSFKLLLKLLGDRATLLLEELGVAEDDESITAAAKAWRLAIQAKRDVEYWPAECARIVKEEQDDARRTNQAGAGSGEVQRPREEEPGFHYGVGWASQSPDGGWSDDFGE